MYTRIVYIGYTTVPNVLSNVINVTYLYTSYGYSYTEKKR